MRFYTSAFEHRGRILVRGYENGRPFARKVNYQPTLFVRGKTPGEWRSIDGRPREPMKFDSMSEAREFLKRYEDVEGFPIEGMTRWVYAFLNEEYPGEIKYDTDLIKVVSLDIEVSTKNGYPNVATALNEVTAITIKRGKTFHVFGCGAFKTDNPNIKYYKCRGEKELLLAFVSEWSREYPDAVTGWNIRFFDIPYLYNRIKFVLDEETANKLSPWSIVSERTVNVMGRDNTTFELAGLSTLDYLELYRKYTYTQQESYKLDNIAAVELDDAKLDYSEYESLQDLYEKNYQKFIEYNIKDVDIIDRLDDKMKLIHLVFALAYDAKVNYIDPLSQTRMWDAIIHTHLWYKKICIPPMKNNSKDEAFEGAYVKEPKIGMHEWVLSFDLNSLYPHLIMQYNISPDTICKDIAPANVSIDELLNPNFDPPCIEGKSLAPNGWYFSNEKQGFLAELMEKLYTDRALYKAKMIDAQKMVEAETSPIKKKEFEKDVSRYKNIQMARKIQLNSAYGAIGNAFFRYYDLRQATAITLGGQLSIRWVANGINRFMNKLMETTDVDYVIASDTDSIYLNFGPLVSKVFEGKDVSKDRIVTFLDRLAKEKVEPTIENIFRTLAVRTNAFSQKMNMKREVIADRGIWTAKKRYILNVWDSEGVRYKEPKIKISGIEAVKSSTPAACRKAIKDTIKLIVTADEETVQKAIADFREKFNKLPFEDIAFPRGLSNLEEGKKATAIHARAAQVYNKQLQAYKLTKKYESIRAGEKIKFCYMKMPNPFHDNVLAIITVLPKEFNMERYIDYNTQFEKAFLDPLNIILRIIGWNAEKTLTVDQFFQ